jgi:hypothetical protein
MATDPAAARNTDVPWRGVWAGHRRVGACVQFAELLDLCMHVRTLTIPSVSLRMPSVNPRWGGRPRSWMKGRQGAAHD